MWARSKRNQKADRGSISCGPGQNQALHGLSSRHAGPFLACVNVVWAVRQLKVARGQSCGKMAALASGRLDEGGKGDRHPPTCS